MTATAIAARLMRVTLASQRLEISHAHIRPASGWIGSAVVADLLAGDHEVLGLARSAASPGLTRPPRLVRLPAPGFVAAISASLTCCAPPRPKATGVVHLAFRHDVAFTGDFETADASDRAAIEVLGEALIGRWRSPRGVAGLKPGRLATEHDTP